MSHDSRFTGLVGLSEGIGDRIEFVAAPDLDTLTGIEHGILFVMAFWSVHSIQAFKVLCRVLKKVDPQHRLSLVVVDIEDLQESHPLSTIVDAIGGWGETVWVRQGQIIARLLPQSTSEWIEQRTRELLASMSD